MSFKLNQNIQVTAIERRTVEFSVNAHGGRGDAFTSVVFYRESVFLDSEDNEIKRARDNEAFEFTPQTISQTPDLAQAMATILRYLDGADQRRMAEQAQQQQ